MHNEQGARSRVLILGYGEMGHAMESLLVNRAAPQVWQRRAPAGAPPVPLEAAAEQADFVLFCVPGRAHAELATRLAGNLAPAGLCLTIAKGLAADGRTPAEVLVAAVGPHRTAALYGPMIAEEIRTGKPAFAECAAPAPESRTRIARLFHGSALRTENADDLTGLSWSVILKNVYAIAFGMADELGLGDNVRGFLAVTALDELAHIVIALGGARTTPHGLAGLGDLITTATSAGSHHRELGRQLARNDRRAVGGEGVNTLTTLRAHPRFDTAPYPLFRLVEDCVREPQDVRARFIALLRRPD